jgi:BlaI family transcriptional regulator, penicillinase repressor
MSRTPAEVTDAELAVLRALWELGPATIRQLTDRLYPDGSASCYATVQKLLERLEGKAFVKRDRSGSVHSFSACVCRDELIGRRLRTVAEKLCGGSLTPLLTHLVRAEKLSAAERAELRELIDKLENHNNKRGAGRKNG